MDDQTIPKTSPRISEIASKYADERIATGKWTPKTAKQSKGIFRLLAEILGDPPIGAVTKADIRQTALDMTKLPANMTKKFPGVSARDVLDRTEGATDVEPLKPRSVNKNYQHLRTLFAWALEHDFISSNPATVLRDVEEGRAQDARKDFDDSDIKRLFAELDQVTDEPYAIWIPRIMAFTGCRMGEAAQLRKKDVRQEQGVWVFDFNTDSDQKNLKTDASARLVPIHPRLIELGLLDFTNACQDEHLFPLEMRFTESASRGNMDRLSKQLNRWLRRAGVTDRKKTFQSFRGTFSTRLKECDVPEYHIAQLMGHENDNITSGRYGKRTKLGALQKVISQLRLPI